MAKLTPTEMKAIANRLYTIISAERDKMLEKGKNYLSKEEAATLDKMYAEYWKTRKAAEDFSKKQKELEQKVQDYAHELSIKYTNKQTPLGVSTYICVPDVVSKFNEDILTNNLPYIYTDKIYEDVILANISNVPEFMTKIQEEYINKLKEALNK